MTTPMLVFQVLNCPNISCLKNRGKKGHQGSSNGGGSIFKLSGKARVCLYFLKDELPTVNASWSFWEDLTSLGVLLNSFAKIIYQRFFNVASHQHY